jgi:uncharacterized protein
MIYLDTSVLVSALTLEIHTARSKQWLTAQQAGTLLVSPWVGTEFMSAIGMKLRSKTITKSDHSIARAAYLRLERDYCTVLLIGSNHFETATDILSDYSLGLRSGDALHLAIASYNAATLCTLDQTLFDACKALGIPCVMP